MSSVPIQTIHTCTLQHSYDSNGLTLQQAGVLGTPPCHAACPPEAVPAVQQTDNEPYFQHLSLRMWAADNRPQPRGSPLVSVTSVCSVAPILAGREGALQPPDDFLGPLGLGLTCTSGPRGAREAACGHLALGIFILDRQPCRCLWWRLKLS